MVRARIVGAVLALAGLLSAPAAANPPSQFDPAVEAQNFSITQQRQAIYDTPRYQAELAGDSLQSQLDGRLAGRFSGRGLRKVTIPGIPGTARHQVRVYEYTRRGLVRRLTRTIWGCGRSG